MRILTVFLFVLRVSDRRVKTALEHVVYDSFSRTSRALARMVVKKEILEHKESMYMEKLIKAPHFVTAPDRKRSCAFIIIRLAALCNGHVSVRTCGLEQHGDL